MPKLTREQEYIETGHRSVPGWFGVADAVQLAAINELQQRDLPKGDLLEIGAYKGRSTILLGYFPRPGEHLFVCDLFGASSSLAANARENETHYSRLRLDEFKHHYLRFHASLPKLLLSSSLDVTPDQLGRGYRLIHVDGSHLYDIVRSDLLLAREVMAPNGVIAVDDVRNVVGVTAAIWEAVADDGLVPISYGSKMYATWSDDAATHYVGRLRDRLASDSRFRFRMQSVRGRKFIEIIWCEDRRTSTRLGDALLPPALRRRLKFLQ